MRSNSCALRMASGVVGDGGQQLDMDVAEAVFGRARDGEHAEQLVLIEHRHGGKRPRALGAAPKALEVGLAVQIADQQRIARAADPA